MNDNTSTSLQTSAARLISLIFQPMLTATYLLLVVSVIATDSMREAAFWGFLAVTVSTGGPALDLRRRVRRGGIPALPAVGWSRVHMKKHTVTQVLAGAVAATALAAVVLGTLQ